MTTPTPPSIIITSEPMVLGRGIDAYFGVVTAEAVTTLKSSGELEGGSEDALRNLRYRAAEHGGDAIVGFKINYKPISGAAGVTMVMVSGTAVKLARGQFGGYPPLGSFGS